MGGRHSRDPGVDIRDDDTAANTDADSSLVSSPSPADPSSPPSRVIPDPVLTEDKELVSSLPVGKFFVCGLLDHVPCFSTDLASEPYRGNANPLLGAARSLGVIYDRFGDWRDHRLAMGKSIRPEPESGCSSGYGLLKPRSYYATSMGRFPYHSGSVTALRSCCPNQESLPRILSGDYQSNVLVCDIEQNKLATLPSPQGPVCQICDTWASGDEDRRLYVSVIPQKGEEGVATAISEYDLEKQLVVGTVESWNASRSSPVCGLCGDSDHNALYALSAKDNQVKIWDRSSAICPSPPTNSFFLPPMALGFSLMLSETHHSLFVGLNGGTVAVFDTRNFTNPVRMIRVPDEMMKKETVIEMICVEDDGADEEEVCFALVQGYDLVVFRGEEFVAWRSFGERLVSVCFYGDCEDTDEETQEQRRKVARGRRR